GLRQTQELERRRSRALARADPQLRPPRGRGGVNGAMDFGDRKMKPDAWGLIWRVTLGSAGEIVASIGGVRGGEARDEWAMQGWVLLMVLGALLAGWGVLRFVRQVRDRRPN